MWRLVLFARNIQSLLTAGRCGWSECVIIEGAEGWSAWSLNLRAVGSVRIIGWVYRWKVWIVEMCPIVEWFCEKGVLLLGKATWIKEFVVEWSICVGKLWGWLRWVGLAENRCCLFRLKALLNKIVACWLRAIRFVGVLLFIDCKLFCCVEEFSMFCLCCWNTRC